MNQDIFAAICRVVDALSQRGRAAGGRGDR